MTRSGPTVTWGSSWGEDGNDDFHSCSHTNNTEQYMGGDGTDYVNDRNKVYTLKIFVEGNALRSL